MIGAIVGDVLGSYYEAASTKAKNFALFHELDRFTDDTVLTVAVARAILESTDDSDATGAAPTVGEYSRILRTVASRYPNAGYGGSFRRWLSDESMGPYNSWGNGSAMRSSPVGWAFGTEIEVLDQAKLTALPTHNHPEGVKGAQAVALAVFMALHGSTKKNIGATVQARFGYDLRRSVDDIRSIYEPDVSCQKSVPEAIVAFLDSANFEDAIRNAISFGGDADTQACIAGAIAEAFYGGVPQKLLTFVLPRLDDFLLEWALAFARRYSPASTTAALDREIDARLVSPGQTPRRKAPYTILMHADAWRRIEDYAAKLAGQHDAAGAHLRDQLVKLPVPKADAQWLTIALLNTKRPQIFAESEISGEGSDWTATELGILGDISVAVPVTIYDDGLHHGPSIHDRPFPGTLLFVPGALLRNGQGGTPADWSVTQGGRVDQDRYESLYEGRLLPLLRYASAAAVSRGNKAFVTIPGLGCGQFAGPFRGTLGVRLREALAAILARHAAALPGIRAVWFDPYSECENERRQIGHISYFVRPLTKNHPPQPQLCPPWSFQERGDDFSGCELFSMVAWDHVSWPGNDFYTGSRSTDDGVKAAASDSMFALTGVRGQYNADKNCYEPPEGFGSWEQVVLGNNLQIRAVDNVIVVDTTE